MTKLVEQEAPGVYVFSEALTYKNLQQDWQGLVSGFFGTDKKIVLNFKNIVRVDSSFLAFLLALMREAAARKVELKMQHVSHDVKSLMQVQGIWPLFDQLMD